MRTHITTAAMFRWRQVSALGLLVCALAIPASAAAQPIDGGYSPVNASTGSTHDGGSDYSSLNSIAPPPSRPGATEEADSGYSSLNSITGAPADAPTHVSGPAGEGDGFDWASALVGAGAALAVAAFGSVALLTLRRRTAITPSTSTG
jgi:hypothetical protein